MIKRSIVVLALLAAISCGSDNPAEPSGSGSSGGNGNTLTATINNAAFTPTFVTGVFSPANGTTPDLLIVAATNVVTGSGTTFGFGCAAPVGTYSIGGSGTSVGTNANLTVINGSTGSAWLASGTVGSGTITVATRTSTTATGSFNLTLAPTTGTGNRVVAGTFSIRF